MTWIPQNWHPHRGHSLSAQTAELILRDIRKGSLRPGDRLPSTRALAEQLSVHRNTIISAYSELKSQGWIEAVHGSGTYVSGELPENLSQESATQPPEPNYSFRKRIEQCEPEEIAVDIDMSGGLPDTRLLKHAEFARSIRNVLRRNPESLDYGSPFGHPKLRHALLNLLREKRALAREESNILLTQGSQMGIYLTAQLLLKPGDRVAVENFGYPPAWQALRLAGANLVPIPLDEEGMLIEDLKRAHKQRAIRAVYVTPHHQFPTLVTMSASRRLALLRFARENRIAILEDDYDHEFHYSGRPIAPMASRDFSGNCIYIGTLSKVLAPGLRIGYVVGPAKLIENLAFLRRHIDSCGEALSQSAVADWLESGEFHAHSNRMRRVYESRRTVLREKIAELMPQSFSETEQLGGMALWLRSKRQLNVDAWMQRALAKGLRVSPASNYCFHGQSHPYIRIGFARTNTEEIGRGVQILADTEEP